MKKLFSLLLMLILCMSFAVAEEPAATEAPVDAEVPAFVNLPFDVGLDEYMVSLARLYGGDSTVEITQINTVPPWNNLTRSRLGRIDSIVPETMDICGYPVDSIELTELVNEQNFEIARMSHITIYVNVEDGKEAEAYEVIKQQFTEVFGHGYWTAQDAKWTSNDITEWYLDDERSIAADHWSSKRTGDSVLKVHYGMRDFQGLWKFLNP